MANVAVVAELPAKKRSKATRGERAARPVVVDWKAQLAKREAEQWDLIAGLTKGADVRPTARSLYALSDALAYCAALPENSIHAIVTDPPYGLIEYDDKNMEKRRNGKGGVWRIPPSFDGAKRSPLPRFTVLSPADVEALHVFFTAFAKAAQRVLVPGGHVFIAANPLLSTMCFHALQSGGLEKRGEIVRLVQTLRGGDKPKGAEAEFADLSVMPRSCHEPWGLFRKPFKGTVAKNLREWGAGALRRPEGGEPFKDLIVCSPTRGPERKLAPHPSLKPQRFLRQLVRASLPLGIGIVFDPFAGSGSTLAAAEAVGYRSVGTDRDGEYFAMASTSIKALAGLKV
ncbi:MAG TPA: site-specific DNA-methyltransferase [Rhabdaerophilum sp.]|nr:site-specific DNA-methyltransferase [Rhabdaerophilum sp.]